MRTAFRTLPRPACRSPRLSVAVRSVHETAGSSAEKQAELRLQILAASMKHVPAKGWTAEAMALGAADAGLPPVAHGIFSRGPVELVEYFMEECAYEVGRRCGARSAELAELDDEARMVEVIGMRLEVLSPYKQSWPQAMALGAHPLHAATTLRNLALLADEMCASAGLVATDARWFSPNP